MHYQIQVFQKYLQLYIYLLVIYYFINIAQLKLTQVWTGILSSIILKEKYTKYNFFTVLVSFTGVLLILKPPIIFGKSNNQESNAVEENRLKGNFFAFISSILDSFVYIILRKIKSKSFVIETIQFFLFGICILSPFGMFNQNQIIPGNKQIISILFLVIVGYLSQLSRTRALQIDKASKLATISYIEIIFASFFDYFIFGFHFTKSSIIGMSLIMSSSIIVYLKSK